MNINPGLLADMTPEEAAAMTGKPAEAPATDAQDAAAGDDTPAVAGEVANDEDAHLGKSPDEPDHLATLPDAPAEPTTYKVDSKDFDAEMATLRTEKGAKFKAWQEGELSDEDWQAFEQTNDDARLALATERARAETLKSINEQNAREAAERTAADELKALQAIATASAKAGQIDYGTDAKAAKQFDMMLSAAKADPDNASKPIAEVAGEVHKAMLAMRGLLKPEKVEKPQRAMPQTLAGLPAAATQPLNQDLATELASITDPDVAEAKWAAMSPSARTAALRASVPRARH